MRIARKVIDGQGGYYYAKEKGEVVLKDAPPSRFELVAKFLEDDRGVTSVTIQKFIKAGAKEYFTLYPAEVTKLLAFFANLKRIHFPDEKGLNITDEALEALLIEPEQAKRVLRGRADLIAALARTEVTEEDVIALAYRKEALKLFQRLLEDPEYFATAAKERGPEAVWQGYFEKNPWIFGYGLSYVFLSSLEGKKLEQVVRGFDLHGSGKRADAVLKTQAQISSLCFVEIKHHHTPLLASSSLTLAEGADTVSIMYDGYDFRVASVTGHVRRNNIQLVVGNVLSGAAVIVLGNPFANRYRVSITADVSHPEVML